MPLDSNYDEADISEAKSATQPKRGEPGSGDKPRKGLSRKTRNWMALAAAAIVVGAGGWFLFGPKGAKAELVTATVQRGGIEDTVLATGVLEPFKLVSVGAQASGQVKKLYVELGDQVKAGDPIADIDNRTQTNTVQNAQAGLSNVMAQKASAEAALQTAQLNYDRQKRLNEAGAASKADLDASTSQLAAATAQLKAVDAQIKQASLSLNTAQTNLGYTKIVAPMDGTIVALVTLEGQTVNANQSAPTIVKLAQLDKMTVSAEISEADVPKVNSGQTVYFTTLGDARTRHYAKLRTVAPAPDSIATETTNSSSSQSTAAVYYNGLFDVDNADGKLKTGMTAQVYIVQAAAKDALLIPSAAIQGRARRGMATVKIVGADGKTQDRQVKIGINTNVQAQVLEGLNEGEKVVVAQASPQQADRQQNNQRNPLAPGGARGMGGGRRSGGG